MDIDGIDIYSAQICRGQFTTLYDRLGLRGTGRSEHLMYMLVDYSLKTWEYNVMYSIHCLVHFEEFMADPFHYLIAEYYGYL